VQRLLQGSLSTLKPLPSGAVRQRNVRARKQQFWPPPQAVLTDFGSKIAKPRARFQNVKILGPYDIFWGGCRARRGGIARAAGLVRERGAGIA
jgi:hypothetical protein